MKRLDKLIKSPQYKAYMSHIEAAEKDRIFCRHGMEHCFDVARILYIYCLENGLDIDKELIYAIGFLHDIGRAKQYTSGTPHHTASAEIAAKLLPLYGFDTEETSLIIKAISAHRQQTKADKLCELVYKADKKARQCFLCTAADACNWDDEKRNTGVDI